MTGRTEIRTRDGQRFGVITHDKIMARTKTKENDGYGRRYFRKNCLINRIDIITIDGRKTWEVRCSRFLDRLEVNKAQ